MASFWIHDPTVLMASDQVTQIWPNAGMSSAQKLNAITRLVIVLSLLGYALTGNSRFAFMGAATVAVVVAYQLAQPPLKEGLETRVDPANYTMPTQTNPLMNVLLPEINAAPNRKPALPHGPETAALVTKKVTDRAGKHVDPRIFRGTNNEIDTDHFMHNFYTTASTTIPNDQEGFSAFLYGDMPSGKEGDAGALANRNVRLGQVTV